MDPREKYNQLLSQAEAIRDGAEAQGRDLTADELAAIEAKLDKADGVKAEIDLQDRLNGMTVTNKPKTASTKAKVESVKPCYENDPKRGFASQTDFFVAVHQAAKTGNDPEFMPDNLRSVLAVSGDGHHTYSDPAGGFLVPSGFLPDVLKIDPEMDPMAGRTTNIPMANTEIKIPARVDKNHNSSVSGGLQVYRRRDEATITAAQMTLEQVKLEANSLFGLAHATEELLSDSAISVAALIAAGFNEEFVSKLIDERINGTGVGEFLGVVNSGCFVSQAKEAGQTADTINFENLIKMRSRVYGYNKAVWLANHDTLPQIAAINDGTNHIFMPSAREDVPDLLLGRPIIFTEYTKTLGDANDIMCCNWSQYLEGTYQPARQAESVHVRFLTHERSFKFWLRNAGSPWWKSALTPKNSSSTLSPFVGLAERA